MIEFLVKASLNVASEDADISPKVCYTRYLAPSHELDFDKITEDIKENLKKQNVPFCDFQIEWASEIKDWTIKICGWDLRGKSLVNQFLNYRGSIEQVKGKATKFYKSVFENLPKRIFIYEAHLSFHKPTLIFDNWNRFNKPK